MIAIASVCRRVFVCVLVRELLLSLCIIKSTPLSDSSSSSSSTLITLPRDSTSTPTTTTTAETKMADVQVMNKRMQLLMNMSCLRLRGLPYSAVEKDVMDFLSIHADFVVGCVHIIFNVQGRPSGEAFLEMANPNAAEVNLLSSSLFYKFGTRVHIPKIVCY